jgi:hypothetical protein
MPVPVTVWGTVTVAAGRSGRPGCVTVKPFAGTSECCRRCYGHGYTQSVTVTVAAVTVTVTVTPRARARRRPGV